MSRERVPTSAQELLEGLAGNLADQIRQIAVRQRQYGSNTQDVRLVGAPSAGKADVVRAEDELSEAQQNEDTAEYHIPVSAIGPGYSQGGVNPVTDMSASGDVDMIIAVDGGAPQAVVFDWTDYRHAWGSDSGNLVAIEMQYKIQALGGAFAAVTVVYVGTPPADYYLVTSGTSGPASAVVIANGAPNNCADDLKLGLANGGVEVVGGVAPRSSAFRFTVARNTSCSSIELRVKADYVDTLAQGNFYVALYSGATADALTRLGVFGFYEAGRTPYSDETLLYLGLLPGGTPGYSLSEVRPDIDMAGSGDVNLNIDVDGSGATPVAFAWAGCDSGWTIAAEMQLKIQALGGPFAAVTVEYLPDAGVNDRYLITSGSVGPGSAVIITDAGANNCADDLNLGIANSGTEVVGLDEEIPLAIGTNYWIAFCGADPRQLTPAAAEVWRVEELHVLKSSILVGHAVKDLVGKHRPEDWTAAPGQFSTHLDLCPWFRLYRRQTVLRNVPASPTMILPSIGERAVMERVDGDHPHRHITSAGGYSSGSRFQRGGGSGGGASSGTGASVVASAPLVANEVVYATGPNTVETDPGCTYDPATDLLTAGSVRAYSATPVFSLWDTGGYNAWKEYRFESDAIAPHQRMTLSLWTNVGAFVRDVMIVNSDAAASQVGIGKVPGKLLDVGGDIQADGSLIVDGGNIGLTVDPDLLGLAPDVLTLRGTLTAGADTDTANTLGRAKIGHWGFADEAMFAHFDHGTVTNYALKQVASGNTSLNAPTGQIILHRIDNVTILEMSATSLSPGTDNVPSLGGANGYRALFLSDANVAAPAAEGEIRAHGTRRAFQAYLGGASGELKKLIHSQVADTVQDGVAEVVVSTHTIPAASWAADKVYSFAASGKVVVPLGNTTTVRVRIGGLGGTILLRTTMNAVTDDTWRLSGELVCRTRAVGGTIGWGTSFLCIDDTFDAESGNGALNTTAAQALVITHDSNDVNGETTVHTFEIWES